MRQGYVYVNNVYAGIIAETDSGYSFTYLPEYLANKDAMPISLTLPLQKESFVSLTMFSFFDGLIPEGWLLDIVTKNWKLDPRDRMGLLLVACTDPIGNVSIFAEKKA